VPLFGSTELALRVERAACSLIAAGAEAARNRDGGDRVLLLPVAGGLAVWAGDGSPLNKVAGAGFAGAIADDELDRLETELEDRSSPIRFELANLGDPANGRLLTERGYALVGFENELGLDLGGRDFGATAPGIEITRSTDDDFEVWLEAVVDGFAHPDEQGVPSDESFPREVLKQVMREISCLEGFVRYVARVDGEIAGGGSLRLSEGVAQLAGAATLPQFRRRGVQSSLLTARLADARAEGCDLAVVTTQPGSKSQQNVSRQGFELLYSKAVLVREPG